MNWQFNMTTMTLKDFCAALILRHYKEVSAASGGFLNPLLSKEEKNELLIRWALSNSVEKLARVVIQNPNLLNRSLNEIEIETSGDLRGEILARDSVIRQMQTGDATRYLLVESTPSLFNGPNHIVSWILLEASLKLEELVKSLPSSALPAWIHEKWKLIKQALKNQLICDVLREPFSRRRPLHQAKREAGSSRNLIYKEALIALHELELIELFDESTILSLLNDTLFSPLENWQLLELATGLGIARSLSEVLDEKVSLRLRLGNERIIAEIGNFLVIWQNSLQQRQAHQLDESELLAKEVATFIGSDLAQSRVDISVLDKETQVAVAHFECKWFGSADYARSAISDASLQICRYVRDSCPDSITEARNLLKNSMIIVSELGRFEEKVDGNGPVGFTDFSGIATGSLNAWATRLVARV
ncbi:hypothetical protein [Shewanella putrefaciens]